MEWLVAYIPRRNRVVLVDSRSLDQSMGFSLTELCVRLDAKILPSLKLCGENLEASTERSSIHEL